MTNFENWKGSRAGKIILHLVRPLHIPKSPGKPTKNILGLRNNKRHVHMHIHTQPVHQLIQGLHTYPDTEGEPKATVLLQFSLTRCWASFISRRGGWEDTEKAAIF